MSDLRPHALVAMGATAIAGIALARRRPEHAPAAWALALLFALNLAGVAILSALSPPGEDVPRGLWPLVYLDSARVLGLVAVPCALCLAVFLERRRLAVAIVAGAWALASIVLAALFPSELVRGAGLQKVYLAADLIGLFASVGAIGVWLRRRRSPGSAQAIAIGLVFLDVAILLVPFSPWRGSVFAGRYDVVQLGIVVFFAAFAAAQGVAVWFSSPR